MELKHLEIFHAVRLTGMLSGAARLLQLTQPAATQALQSAELQLGFALFTRQRNRLVPTGEALAVRGPVSLAEVLRQPGICIDERDPLGALLAEQGFGPAVIDSFTAAARRDAGLVVQDIEPEVPVGLYAPLPPRVRSGRVAAAFIEAFGRAVGSSVGDTSGAAKACAGGSAAESQRSADRHSLRHDRAPPDAIAPRPITEPCAQTPNANAQTGPLAIESALSPPSAGSAR